MEVDPTANEAGNGGSGLLSMIGGGGPAGEG